MSLQPTSDVPEKLHGDGSLLIVDDDKPFLTRLTRAMASRGFQVEAPNRWPRASAPSRRAPPPMR